MMGLNYGVRFQMKLLISAKKMKSILGERPFYWSGAIESRSERRLGVENDVNASH